MNNIPAIADLYTSILNDLQTEYGVTIPTTGKVFLRAMAAVQAAKLKLFYLSVAFLQKNIFVDTADPEASGGTLERFGRVKIGRNPFPATAGYPVIRVQGTANGTIPAGTVFKSDDTSTSPNMLYILDNAYAAIIGNNDILLRSLTAGTAAKLVAGDTLTATAPIAVASSAGVVILGSNPQDAENIEDYRQKVIASYQLTPQGGSSSDYRIWGLTVQGVQQIYPYATYGAANQVSVYVEATTTDSTDGKGTPTSTILTNVAAAIEANRPLGVFQVNTLPIALRTIDINISGLVGASIPISSIQTTINSAITEMVNGKRPFIGGADNLSTRNDNLSTNNIVNTILQAAAGSVFGAVTLKVDGVAVQNYTFDTGNIPTLNSINYV